MQDADWLALKYFKRTESWGDPDKMSKDLLTRLDGWRGFISRPITILCGTQGAHVSESQHPEGLAVDVLSPGGEPRDLLDMFFAATRYGFTGVGLYPYWKYNGKKTGGLHLDVRTLAPGDHGALWMAVPITLPDGKVDQHYIALTRENLAKHGVIGVMG